MKIEIDLNDILGDEYGAESLQDSVRRQVIDAVTKATKEGVTNQINVAVATTIQDQLQKYVETEMPALMATILDADYRMVNRWGERQQETTTFRKELVKTIHENMVYKKTTYSHDANAFTKAVDGVIEDGLKSFKEEFKRQVDAQFTAQVMYQAVEGLKKKMGIA